MSRQDWVGAAVGVGTICVTIAVSSGSTNARIDDLGTNFRTHVQYLRADLRDLRDDVDNLRGDVANLRYDVDSLRGDVDGLRSDVDRLNGLLLEHTTGHAHDGGSL